MTESDVETANELNQAFQSVFVNESNLDVPEFGERYNGTLLENIEIDVDSVKNILKKTNVNKSMGPDGIHPKFLNECYIELASPITMIIKDSLAAGILPTLWKIAKICPIFKKGDKLDPLNYRPISLTCIICKICETIVRDRLMEHLDFNNILRDRQHGFRNKHSNVINLLEYLEVLTKAVDN